MHRFKKTSASNLCPIFSTLLPSFPVCFSLSQTELLFFFAPPWCIQSTKPRLISPLSFSSSSQTLSSSSAANVIYLIWVINQFGLFLLFVERVDKAWSDNCLAPALIPLREGCLLAGGEEEQQNILIRRWVNIMRLIWYKVQYTIHRCEVPLTKSNR